MNITVDETSCGTTACIGGWVKVHHLKAVGKTLSRSQRDAVDHYVNLYFSGDGPLHKLYWPTGHFGARGKTVAKTVERFLETGKVKWR